VKQPTSIHILIHIFEILYSLPVNTLNATPQQNSLEESELIVASNITTNTWAETVKQWLEKMLLKKLV
jgi:hypothetical protein